MLRCAGGVAAGMCMLGALCVVQALPGSHAHVGEDAAVRG